MIGGLQTEKYEGGRATLRWPAHLHPSPSRLTASPVCAASICDLNRCPSLSLPCAQYHPEASPGPHDADVCFEQYIEMLKAERAARV